MKRFCVAVVLLVASCGRTSGPVEIPADELPFPVTRSVAPTGSPDADQVYGIYLVRDDRLEMVTRRTDSSIRPPLAVLRSLFEGPTRDERERAIGTRIPSGVRVLAVSVRDGDADVDLSAEFQEPAPPERIALRIGQVVWTLTGLDSVRTVSFSIGGEPISVTTDKGDHVERRLTRQDYSDLAPRD